MSSGLLKPPLAVVLLCLLRECGQNQVAVSLCKEQGPVI